MSKQDGPVAGLWSTGGGEGGGEGGPVLVLLHGLGATASVWDRFLPILRERWPHRWLAVDLRGHGRSPHLRPYGYAAHAADVAAAIGGQDQEVAVIGHSMGGVIGMALATGWFGVSVRSVLAFGVKIAWTDEEVAKGKAIAQAAPRRFERREDAIDRYLKVSGLSGLVDPASPEAALGVVEEDGGFRLAADPWTNAAVGPSVESFHRAAMAPVRLAAGTNDPMVTGDQMRALDPDAVVVDGVGHTFQLERPDLLWELFEAAPRRS